MRDPREDYYDLVFAKIRRDREAKDTARPAPISAHRLPAPAAPPPPAKTAAEREFDAVKSAALARQAAAQKAAADALAARQAEQAEEDRAVAMILDARNL